MTQKALEKLPPRIAIACRNAASLYGGRINEIRLRRGSPASITVRGENIVLGVSATEEEIARSVRLFCDLSMYTHAETICDGYIASRGGFRVGIVGRAVVRDGKITSVADVGALNIRIPERVIGCADRAYDIMSQESFRRGLLVWSPPGIGKTTLLRELAVRLASGKNPKRVALVDTRVELSPGIEGAGIIDVLSAYPRAKGIEIASRTLAAQIVICDEISGEEDMRAVLGAYHAGITVAASAHASSVKGLLSSDVMSALHEKGVFGTYYGLLAQENGGFVADIKNGKDIA